MGKNSRVYPAVHPKLGELIVHISQGSSPEVVELVSQDPLLANTEHPSGTTPLFYAVRHQTPGITEHLIEMGANVNPSLPGRESLRQMADELPDQDILDALLFAGARGKSRRKLLNELLPVIPTIAELTADDLPLCEATRQPARFTRIAKTFKLRRLRQLLTFACREQAEPLATRLIQILPTVDYCTDDEGSPLLEAALAGSLELVRALRRAGSTRELIGAFDFAVERGHVAVAAELLPEIRDKKFKNYFDRVVPGMAERSATKGYTALAELLLPFASKRSAAITRRKIDQWRENYYDLVPQHFAWPREDPF